jgi:polar amino acid transport system permease protein
MGNYEWGIDVALNWFPYVFSGVWVTILITAGSMIIGLFVGIITAMIRVSGKQPLTAIATAYTEFFRNTPMYTQLIWVFYVIPFIVGFSPAPIIAALTGLSLNVGAFAAEDIRAGIVSISAGQWDAAYAIGMTNNQAYRRIILPQAIVRILPPLISLWVTLFKETSIVSLVGIGELMFRARFGAYRTYRTIEMFSMVALIYFVLTWPQARFSDWIYEKLRVK